MTRDELRTGKTDSHYFEFLSRGEDVPYERRNLSTTAEAHIVVCRVCWTHTHLVVEKIDLADGRAYHRCPQCDASSLIRWVDAMALGVADTGT